jgi:hypothetical protein
MRLDSNIAEGGCESCWGRRFNIWLVP